MKVEHDVLAVLSRAQIAENRLVLTGQLDRKLYERTNKVLEAAGGVWNRKAKAHLFEGCASTRIEQVILTGSIEIPKDEFEFFPTPADLAIELVNWAEPKADTLALEPSAGRGGIANPMRDAGLRVHCYEMLPANAQHLREQGHQVEEVDFLTVVPAPVYRTIVMNPPFSRQKDILHVQHALKFLDPDIGRLVSVMAAGVVFRQDRRATEFRDLVASRGGQIRPLPAESFKASGTTVNTVVAIIPAR